MASNRPSPSAAAGSAGATGGATPSGTSPVSNGPGPDEGNPEPTSITGESAGPVGSGGGLADAGAAGSADAGGAVGDIPAACPRDVTDANKALVSAAIDELFVQGDIGAVDRYWGEPYLQHNPIAASGVETFRGLFGGLVSPGNPIYALSRIVGECELVLIHGNYTSFGGPTFDMFRVDGGRIVEHWDAAATGAGPNTSGHTALDGATVVQDVALTGQNEALVLGFAQAVLIGQAYDTIGDYMSPALIEHDPQSSDGSDAYIQRLQSGSITYSQIHHDIADGDFVFVLSEGAVGPTSVGHYDLFRVESGRIAEHWNGRRDVPATTQSGLGIF